MKLSRSSVLSFLFCVWTLLNLTLDIAEGEINVDDFSDGNYRDFLIAGDRYACPPFSCGHLRNVSFPFRRQGDPSRCGVEAYQLNCNEREAIIQIDGGTYYVKDINYTDASFWVVDASIDMHSSCPLPQQWNKRYYLSSGGGILSDWLKDSDGIIKFATVPAMWSAFVNCSEVIKNNNSWYRPVGCLSTNSSFVYVLTTEEYSSAAHLESSCGFLAMVPWGSWRAVQLESYADITSSMGPSYADIMKFIRGGFVVLFPFEYQPRRYTRVIHVCLQNSMSYFHDQISSPSLTNLSRAFVWTDIHFLQCINNYSLRTTLFWASVGVVSALDIIKCAIALALLLRLVVGPLAVLTFLANIFFKTKTSLDAVEKFLRMQQVLGPTRYAYTDIIAITSHFRHKLGQGGYGSVYEGTLPGDVRVAVKMLGSSKCNGDDFISEVSTIGRIHHINVVRLVGFCAEEKNRALIYELMPRGSLDKYIFSSERNVSWDKLNEVALGIARGIDYLHRGCDMQILHFDIKPHNILLDSNFIPKVADFGLAKLYPRDDSFVPLSAARGTIGYIAPEMISRSFGKITNKSDVYSFGMLLLEMAGGRRNADPNAAYSSRAYYPSWVYDRLTNEQEKSETSSASADMHELEKKLCIVGLSCIQMKSVDRPMMTDIIEMLEGGVDRLKLPSRPFFCDDEQIPVVDSSHFSSQLAVISESEDDE